jgi:hypothetical protein
VLDSSYIPYLLTTTTVSTTYCDISSWNSHSFPPRAVWYHNASRATAPARTHQKTTRQNSHYTRTLPALAVSRTTKYGLHYHSAHQPRGTTAGARQTEHRIQWRAERTSDPRGPPAINTHAKSLPHAYNSNTPAQHNVTSEHALRVQLCSCLEGHHAPPAQAAARSPTTSSQGRLPSPPHTVTRYSHLKTRLSLYSFNTQ